MRYFDLVKAFEYIDDSIGALRQSKDNEIQQTNNFFLSFFNSFHDVLSQNVHAKNKCLGLIW